MLSCVILKNWKMNILVIINGAVLVSESVINLCMEIFGSRTYSPFAIIEWQMTTWIPILWIWTEPLGRLSNLLCLGYAMERYVIICGSKEWSQCHSYSLIAVYVIITVLVEFSYPLISILTNYDYYSIDAGKATCIVLSVSYCLKLGITIFGLILHVLIVLAMNKRLDTSIFMHISLKKDTKVKNCKRIKKFNLSILILLLCHTVMDMICDATHMIDPFLCTIDFGGVNEQLGTLFFNASYLIEKVNNLVEAAAQVLFTIFHFIFLPSFISFFCRVLLFVTNLVRLPVDPHIIS